MGYKKGYAITPYCYNIMSISQQLKNKCDIIEQELRLFNNEPDKPATLKLSSWCRPTQIKLVLMFMNVHELFMKIH